MKRNNLCIATVSLVLIGCYSNRIHPTSNFMSNFSIEKIIEEMKVSELQQVESPKTGTSVGGDPSEHRRYIEIRYVIKESPLNRFDEKRFLSELKERVEKKTSDLTDSTSGAGGGGDNFYLSYKNGSNFGSIDVIGSRVEGDRYKIWCIINELATGEKTKDQ
jgi:hypothetical protein